MSSPSRKRVTARSLDAAAKLFGAPLVRNGWEVRLATPEEVPELLKLRARVFRGDDSTDDTDEYDAGSLHLRVGRVGQGGLATLRLRRHRTGDSLSRGYAARFYDLGALRKARGETLELGRLCTDPDARDPDILRLVWAGVARLVLSTGAARMIGCTSFHTTDPKPLRPALGLLAARYLGPIPRRPGRKATETFGFDDLADIADPKAATKLPPLLRAYLSMGGWVSDHMVIDRDLGTCHVFTCVDVDSMPEARKRSLTALAGG